MDALAPRPEEFVMDIGKPETEREIHVAPLEEPLPRSVPVPAPQPVETPAEEPLPA